MTTATALREPHRWQAPARLQLAASSAAATLDFFSFSAAQGPASFTLELLPAWSSWERTNLDASVAQWACCSPAQLLASWDASGGILAGTFPFTLPAEGVYCLGVTGTGDGTSWPATGSLGTYRLTVSYTPASASLAPGAACPSPPSPSPSPSPPPLPPARPLAIKRSGGGVVTSGKWRSASLSLRAADPITGVSITVQSDVSITISWQVTGLAGTTNSTATITAGTSTATTTLPRTTLKSASFTYRIASVSASPDYAYDPAASDVGPYTFA